MLYKEKYFIYYGSRHGLIFNDRSARDPRALSFNGVICTVTSMPSMNFRSLIRKYSLVGLRCTLVPISSHPPPGPSTSPESSASLVLDVCVGRQQPRDKVSQGAKNRKEKKRAQINPIPNNGTSGAPDQSYSQKGACRDVQDTPWQRCNLGCPVGRQRQRVLLNAGHHHSDVGQIPESGAPRHRCSGRNGAAGSGLGGLRRRCPGFVSCAKPA